MTVAVAVAIAIILWFQIDQSVAVVVHVETKYRGDIVR